MKTAAPTKLDESIVAVKIIQINESESTIEVLIDLPERQRLRKSKEMCLFCRMYCTRSDSLFKDDLSSKITAKEKQVTSERANERTSERMSERASERYIYIYINFFSRVKPN